MIDEIPIYIDEEFRGNQNRRDLEEGKVDDKRVYAMKDQIKYIESITEQKYRYN